MFRPLGAAVYTRFLRGGRARSARLAAAIFSLSLFLSCAGAQTTTVIGSDAVPTTVFSGLRDPQGVAVDVLGNIYVADLGSQRIVEIAPSADGYQFSATVASASTMGATFLPTGVAVDSVLDLYVADEASGRILRFLWNGTGYDAPTAVFSGTSGAANLVVDGNTDVFVADPGNRRVVEVPWNGTAYASPITLVANTAVTPAIALDGAAGLYYSDGAGSQIMKTNWTGSAYTPPVAVLSGVSASGIAIDIQGNLYFTSFGEVYNSVWNGNGYETPNIMGSNSSFSLPQGLAINQFGTLFVSDADGDAVFSMLSPGNFGQQAVGTWARQRSITFRFDIPATLGQHAVVSSLESPNFYESPYDFVDLGDGYDNGCSAGSHGAGSTCTVLVNFLPHHAGFLSGALKLFDANGNVLGSVPLSGYGAGADIVFNPTQTNFPIPVGLGSFAFDGAGNLFYVGTGNLQEFARNGSGFSAPLTLLSNVDQYDLGVDGGGNVYVVPSGVAYGGAYSVVKIPREADSSASPGGNFGAPFAVWTGSSFQTIYVNACGLSWKLWDAIPTTSGAGKLFNLPCVAYPLSSGTAQTINAMTVDQAGNLYLEADAQGIVEGTPGAEGSLGSNPTTSDLGTSIIKVPVGGNGYGAAQVIGPSDLQSVFPPGVTYLPLAVDSQGNVYIGNHGNSTGEILELFFSGGGYSSPSPIIDNLNWGEFGYSMAFDSNDNLYLTSGDALGNSGELIRASFNGSSWSSSTVAVLPNEQLPSLAIDAAGNPWISAVSNDIYAAGSFLKLDVTSVPTLAFPTSTFVGQTDTTDGPRSATLFNIGNEPLALDPTYPASFPENQGDASLCAAGGMLAVGESCDVSLDFTPASAGTLTQTVSISGNAPPSTAAPSIPASGVGLSDLALVFGTAPAPELEVGGNAGGAITVEVENLGTLVTSANPTITLTVQGPNSYSAIYVENAAAGIATFNLASVPLTIPGAYTYVATGGSYAPATASEAVVAAVTTRLAFGTPPAGIVVSGGNAGSGITVLEEDVNGYVRQTASDQITLSVNGPAGYSASYLAQASAGIATFNLGGVPLITPGSYTYQATVGSSLAVTAVETVNVSPVNFGSVNVGASSAAQAVPVMFLINADGLGSTAKVLTQGAVGGDFALGSGGTCSFGNDSSATYTAGSSCTLNLIFTPEAPGVRYGAVMVYTLDGVLVAEQFVSGTGVAPRASFNGQREIPVFSDVSHGAPASGLAVDGAGDVIVSDPADYSVELITPNAGGYSTPKLLGGVTSFTDDGNPAQAVLWFSPGQVALDGAGYAYVTEGGDPSYGAAPMVVKTPTLVNGSIPAPTPETEQPLGSGWVDPTGIAVDAGGNVYVSDLGTGKIYELPWVSNGYGSQILVAAGINALQLAVDGYGNIFAAAGQNSVLELSPVSGGFAAPVRIGNWNAVGVAVDGSGNLYIDDDTSGQVIRVPWTGSAFGPGLIVASPGIAGRENGVAVDSAGNVYVSSAGNNSVEKVDTVDPPALYFASTTAVGAVDTADGPQTLELYDTGNASLAFTSSPSPGNPLYPASFPANTSDSRLCSSSSPVSEGSLCDISANFAPQTSGVLSASITISDNSVGAALQTVAVSGATIDATPPVLYGGTEGAFNVANGGIGIPVGIAVDAAENVFLIDDWTYSEQWSPSGAGVSGYTMTSQSPDAGDPYYSIAVDNNDNLYQGSYNQFQNPPGLELQDGYVIATGLHAPVATALDPAQTHLYVADVTPPASAKIWEETAPLGFSTLSPVLSIAGSNTVLSLAADSAGDIYLDVLNQTTWVCQELKYTPAAGGSYTQTVISNYCSSGIAASDNGTIYIFNGSWVSPQDNGYENYGDQVLQQTPNGLGGWSANSILSGLNGPEAMSLDPNGNLWVADTSNGRVIEISVGLPVFPGTAVGSTSSTSIQLTVQPGTTIGSVSILTLGQPGLDYTDGGASTCLPQAYPTGTSCVVNVSFTPTVAGVRRGELLIADGAGKTLLSVPLAGVGQASEPVFNTGALTQIIPAPQPSAVFGGTAVDGGGNLYAAVPSLNEVLYSPAGGASSVLSLGSPTANPNPGQGSISAALNAPAAVAVDGGGRLYIADTGNNRIVVRQPVPGSSTGHYYLYALATPGISLNAPNGVVVDSAGNVDVLDGGNTRVVQVTPTGQATVLSNVNIGNSALLGIAVDGQNNVYLAGGGQVRRFGANPALIYSGNPQGMAFDAAGDLYIADYQTAAGIVVIPPGGSPQLMNLGSPAGYEAPSAISVDSTGNLYVTYEAIYEVIRNTASLNYDSTIVHRTSSDSPKTLQFFNAGNQPLTFGTITYPADFPVNTSDASLCQNGNALVPGASCDISAAFLPSTTGTLAETIAISDTAPSGSQFVFQTGTALNAAALLAFSVPPPSNLWAPANPGPVTVVEMTAGETQDFAGADIIALTITGPGGYSTTASGTATEGTLIFNLSGVEFTAAGQYTFTAQSSGLTPAIVTSTVTVPVVGESAGTQSYAVNLANPGTLSAIQVFTMGAMGKDFALATGGTCTIGSTYTAGQSCTANVSFTPLAPGQRAGEILLVDAAGDVLGTTYISGVGQGPQIAFGPQSLNTLETGLLNPNGIAVDGNANLYVSEWEANQIVKLPWTGNGYGTPTAIGTGISGPGGVAVDGGGNVYIADYDHHRVLKEPWTGSGYGNPTTVGSDILYPEGLAVDANGNVYVAGWADNQVHKVSWTGSGFGAQTTVGTGLSRPTGVAVDGSGDVFIADYGNSRIVEVPWTAAGYGPQITIASGLSSPEAVAVDGSGDVYFADYGSGDVVQLRWTGSGFAAPTIMTSGMSGPDGVTVDGRGNVYAADWTVGNAIELNVASAPQVSFTSPTPVGKEDTTDGPQTVYVTNIGNEPLQFASGTNPVFPSDFAENMADSQVCAAGAVLTEGSGCDISIDFVPAAAGPRSGSIMLRDDSLDDPNASQSIVVSGVAVAGTSITWAPPAPIPYGTALSAKQLDAKASVPGTFVYSPAAGTVLTAGTQTLSVTFTPTDTTDYTTATTTVTVKVNQKVPHPDWPAPASITYGTALTSKQLDAYSAIAGSFAYTPPIGTLLTAGTHTLSATFTPTDTVDYATVTVTNTIIVNPATPAITWKTPAPITYGAALSVTQLDATAKVNGTFVYSPGAGRVLTAGSQTLTVTFTPADTADYTTATAHVTLKVNQKVPHPDWPAPAAITFGTALSSKQLNAYSAISGTFVYTPPAGTVLSVGTHTLSATFTPTDTTDFTTATAAVALTVNQAP